MARKISILIIMAVLLAGPAVSHGQSAGQITRLEALVENLEKQAASLQAELKAIREELMEIKAGGTGTLSRPFRRGETSGEVQKIQEFLKQLPGIYPEGLTTGFFGELTEKAIRRFQEKYGIEQTGIIDSALYAKINELRGIGRDIATSTALTPSATSTSPTPLVSTSTTIATSSASIATSTASSSLRFSFVYPVYGDRLIASTSQTIQWNSSEQRNVVPTVQLDLYSGGVFIETIASGTPNTGRYEWSPPARLAGNTFTIRLWSVKYPNNIAESVSFPIVSLTQSTTNTSSYGTYASPASTSGSGGTSSAASTNTTGTSTTSTTTSTTATSTTATSSPVTITVTSPSGGETWTQGETRAITWTSTGNPSYITIELWYAGAYKEALTWQTNSGSWDWVIPTNRAYETGASYSIRVKYNESTYDDSTGSFSIVLPAVTTLDSSGLIGFWKFDGNGNNEIAGSPNAVAVGNATFSASGGKIGGYAYLSGSTDYVKIPYNSMFDLPNAFTIEFWFRQRSNQSFNQRLVSKGTPINNYNFDISRWLWNEYNSGPIIAGSTAASTGYWHQASNGNQLAHGVWHHVVYTRTTTENAYYLDGNATYSGTLSSEYAGATKTPAVDIIIGNPAPDTDIDNLRIYNRAITSLEAVQRYSNPTLTLKGREEIAKQLADIASALSALMYKARNLLAR